MIWVGSLGASRYSASDATAGNGLSQSHPCGPSTGGRAPCCTHTRAHFLPSPFHVHPGARITLQPLPCILHPEARGASALGPCRGNASLLLCFWVLDHLAVFTLGIPAVRESLLGKGARTVSTVKAGPLAGLTASLTGLGILSPQSFLSFLSVAPGYTLGPSRQHPAPQGHGSPESPFTLPSSAQPANSPLTLTLLLRGLEFYFRPRNMAGPFCPPGMIF